MIENRMRAVTRRAMVGDSMNERKKERKNECQRT